MLLADIIAPNLEILFVGYNPSLKSAEVGHHFAGRNNRFWQVLYDSGLTKQRLTAEQDGSLLGLRMGLTNLVSRPTRAAAELTSADYRQGSRELLEKLAYYRPEFVCYVGIGVYRALARLSKCQFGWQPQSVAQHVTDFVAPSTSGLNRMPYGQQLAIYCQLAERVRKRTE